MVSDLEVVLAAAFALFFVGFYALTSKRDGIRIIMGIELLVASVSMLFIAFGFVGDNKAPMAQTFTLISLAIGGAVIGLALAILSNLFARFGTINTAETKDLRW
ncbi:MAG: NADH-quinone oxidoreductase subunit NuoK [Candidatus Heimdallarchaeota archaeon]